jgi:hypothetical protein
VTVHDWWKTTSFAWDDIEKIAPTVYGTRLLVAITRVDGSRARIWALQSFSRKWRQDVSDEMMSRRP